MGRDGFYYTDKETQKIRESHSFTEEELADLEFLILNPYNDYHYTDRLKLLTHAQINTKIWDIRRERGYVINGSFDHNKIKEDIEKEKNLKNLVSKINKTKTESINFNL